MTKKWNLVIDINRCNGCYNCAIAAKDEYVDNAEPGYFSPQPRHGQEWVDVIQKERGQYPAIDVHYVPVMCNHCDDAPCMKAAKNGAVTKREDGIVVVDADKAKGQKAIADACPYGAMFWNEELQIPQHWPFDAHLLDRGWTAPRAVEVCATGAMRAYKVEDAEMAELARRDNLSVRRPELGTRPRVYYKNFGRDQSEFIAGTAAMTKNGLVECAAGATVTLSLNGSVQATTNTDAFGDFRFDGLPQGTGPFELVVEGDSGRSQARVEKLERSLFVGRLMLA